MITRRVICRQFPAYYARNHSVRSIIAPHAHERCRKWIMFSDLHVRGSSIATCEEVLEQVHTTASKLNGGVIFLGDFWHVRGALSVELLNRIMAALHSWTQPVIMIPGNHDQVSLCWRHAFIYLFC